MRTHAGIRIGRLWNVAFYPRVSMRIMACLTCLLLLGLWQIVLPAAASARVSIDVSVNVAPPALPVYTQPPCPGPGYIWTPGYWAWDPDDADYYWVPGTWVVAPYRGALWTPSYWGWERGAYVWHRGYWGPEIGYYGGINYGHGYGGRGYEGGYWRRGEFFYNKTVNNVTNVNVTNVYKKTIINNINVTHVSYNGGPGGSTLRPTPRELTAARQHHFAPTDMQRQHEMSFKSDPRQRASMNRGRPSIAAMPKPNMRPVARPQDANYGAMPHPGNGLGKNPAMAGGHDRFGKPTGIGNHPGGGGNKTERATMNSGPGSPASRKANSQVGTSPVASSHRPVQAAMGNGPASPAGHKSAQSAMNNGSGSPTGRKANGQFVAGQGTSGIKSDRAAMGNGPGSSAGHKANGQFDAGPGASGNKPARAAMNNGPASSAGHKANAQFGGTRPAAPRPAQAAGHPSATPRPAAAAHPAAAPHAAPKQQNAPHAAPKLQNAPHHEQHG